MEAPKVQEDIEAIYSDPRCVDMVIELLGMQDMHIEAVPPESEADDVTRRVCLKILLRMKMRHTEKEDI